jgi:hypothetical protein
LKKLARKMGAPQKLLDAADDARAAVSLILDLHRPRADEDADGRGDDSGSAELYTCIWNVYISGTRASL